MNNKFLKYFIACFLVINFNLMALDKVPVISLDLAKEMADACEANQEKIGYRKINIAIVDSGANLILFRKQNGAFLGSTDIAIAKAKSSARIPFPTRLIGEIAYGKDGEPGRVPGIVHIKDIVAFAGGLPIRSADGTLLGAIGVSGASSDEDEICAQAAIDAIKSKLK
tara:strand:+ start:172 stop:675 length:504 start_codon:yes stop_codon:yes gene_type:complete